MANSITDLITAKSKEDCLTSLLAALTAGGIDTATWSELSVQYRLLAAFAAGLSGVWSALAVFTQSRFRRLAKDAWLDLLLSDIYPDMTPRYESTFAEGAVSIRDVSGGGPHSITAGQLWFTTSDGTKKFTNKSAFTITKSGTVTATVVAESSGTGYNIGIDTLTTLATPIPGVGFAVGETSYNPGTGGTWLSVQAIDDESNEALVVRSGLYLSTLGSGATADQYKYWCLTADTASVITRCRVIGTMNSTNYSLRIYIASAVGAVSAGDVEICNDLITSKAPSCVRDPSGGYDFVLSASDKAVDVTATIYVYAGHGDTAETLAEDALAAYLRSFEIGGKGSDPNVYADMIKRVLWYDNNQVHRVVMTVPSSDIVLDSDEVPVLGTINLTIEEVSL